MPTNQRMCKKSAFAIIRESGMCNDPSYYSGRGAIIGDLNSEILEKVYQGIKSEHGESAAKAYEKLVAAIPKLSATDFLVSLYGLQANGWKFSKRILSKNKGIYAGNLGSALGTIASVAGGMYERDETGEIRAPFLSNHNIAPKMKFTVYDGFVVKE